MTDQHRTQLVRAMEAVLAARTDEELNEAVGVALDVVSGLACDLTENENEESLEP